MCLYAPPCPVILGCCWEGPGKQLLVFPTLTWGATRQSAELSPACCGHLVRRCSALRDRRWHAVSAKNEKELIFRASSLRAVGYCAVTGLLGCTEVTGACRSWNWRGVAAAEVQADPGSSAASSGIPACWEGSLLAGSWGSCFSWPVCSVQRNVWENEMGRWWGCVRVADFRNFKS